MFTKKRVGETCKEKSLVEAAEARKDSLIESALSTVTSVWVSDACYKHFALPGNVNKTVNVSGAFTGAQINHSFEKRH